MDLDILLDNSRRYCVIGHYRTFYTFLEFDAPKSLKVKSNDTFRIPTYDFLSVFK